MGLDRGVLLPCLLLVRARLLLNLEHRRRRSSPGREPLDLRMRAMLQGSCRRPEQRAAVDLESCASV